LGSCRPVASGRCASDHADPLNVTDPNANITGLFIFPKDDQYVLIFNVRKSLTNANRTISRPMNTS
jgi:hypothetical protein